MTTDDLVRALASAYSPDELELALPYLSKRAVDARATSRLDQADVLTRLGDQLAAAHALGAHHATASHAAAADARVTPEELREVGDRALALFNELDALQERFHACDDEPTRQFGNLRLYDAIGQSRLIAADLESTARDLERMRRAVEARDPQDARDGA